MVLCFKSLIWRALPGLERAEGGLMGEW